jgi:hypothetical protein
MVQKQLDFFIVCFCILELPGSNLDQRPVIVSKVFIFFSRLDTSPTQK